MAFIYNSAPSGRTDVAPAAVTIPCGLRAHIKGIWRAADDTDNELRRHRAPHLPDLRSRLDQGALHGRTTALVRRRNLRNRLGPRPRAALAGARRSRRWRIHVLDLRRSLSAGAC